MFIGILREKLVAEKLLFLDFMLPHGTVPISITKSLLPHPPLQLVNFEECKGLAAQSPVLSFALFGLDLACAHHLL